MCGVVGKCVIMRALSPHHNVSLTNKGRKKLRRKTIREKGGEKYENSTKRKRKTRGRERERERNNTVNLVAQTRTLNPVMHLTY